MKAIIPMKFLSFLNLEGTSNGTDFLGSVRKGIFIMKRQFAKIADFKDCGAAEMSIPQSWIDWLLQSEADDDLPQRYVEDYDINALCDEPKCGPTLDDIPIVDD